MNKTMIKIIKYILISLLASYIISTIYLFNYTDISIHDNSLVENIIYSFTFYLWIIILLISGGQPF